MKHFLSIPLFFSFVIVTACGSEEMSLTENNLQDNEWWKWTWVQTYYHPYNGEGDMGPHTSACKNKVDLWSNKKYFAINELGPIWKSLIGDTTCYNDRWEPCHWGNDCAKHWNRIPQGYKRGWLGQNAEVRIPDCDNAASRICGKRFLLKNPKTGHMQEGIIGDICPNNHWNNKLANNCQNWQNVLDLYVDLYKALGGTFQDNLQVHVRPN